MSQEPRHADRELTELEWVRARLIRNYRLRLMLRLTAAVVITLALGAAVWKIRENVVTRNRADSLVQEAERDQQRLSAKWDLPLVITPLPAKVVPPAAAFFDLIHPDMTSGCNSLTETAIHGR